jgi:hypothetical protein
MGTGMASPLASPASCCWIVIGCVRALEQFECGRREVKIYDLVVLSGIRYPDFRFAL